MKKIFLFLAVVVGLKSNSQNIGINPTGVNADPSAALDIVSSNKGLLIPRVALTALNSPLPITAPLVSLMIYNTATSGVAPNNVVPGYYYWDGLKWISVNGSSSGGLNWNLFGNLGTNSTTNFLGTSDNQDLVFRTNNTEKMRILGNGQIGIGTSVPNAGSTLDITGPIKVPHFGTFLHNDPAVVGVPLNDGFRMKTVNNYLLTNVDVLAFEKTDFNNPVVDGGIVFTNTGMAGVEELALAIRGNGNVGINTINPTEKLHISQGNIKLTNNSYSGIINASYNSLSQHPFFMGIMGRGTEAAPTYPNLGDALNCFTGRDAIDYAAANYGGSAIYMHATENYSSSNKGTNITFYTTPNGTNASVQRALINHDGLVGIGTAVPLGKLHVESSAAEAILNIGFSGQKQLIMGNSNSTAATLNSGLGAYSSIQAANGELRFGLTQQVTPNTPQYATFMTISNIGNVGIGNLGANNRLEITSASANTSGLRFTNLTSASPTVGANSKSLSVDVNGDVILVPSAASSGNEWSLTGNSGTTPGTNFLGTTDANALVFKTNNIERIRVLNNGQVGIGIAAPIAGSLIDIGGPTKLPGSGTLIYNDPAVTGIPLGDRFRMKYDGNFFGAGFDVLVFEKTDFNQSVPDGGIAFTNTGMSGTEVLAMTIRGNGDVGIGVNPPAARLDIYTADNPKTLNSIKNFGGQSNTSAAFIGGIDAGFTNTGVYFVQKDNVSLSSTGTFLMNVVSNSVSQVVVNGAGQVGIGTTVPTCPLSVNGCANKVGGGTWAVFSDKRVKQNINSYSKGLDYILKINPVSFEYNGKGGYSADGKTYIGVIAQDIEKVLPSTVSKIKTADFEDQRMFDASELTFTLINAVKELQEQITSLKKENSQLKNSLFKVNDLEAKVEQLLKIINKGAEQASK